MIQDYELILLPMSKETLEEFVRKPSDYLDADILQRIAITALIYQGKADSPDAVYFERLRDLAEERKSLNTQLFEGLLAARCEGGWCAYPESTPQSWCGRCCAIEAYRDSMKAGGAA
jgi:hypothetical protein